MKKIILLLGASNDADGRLSQMAVDRLECAYSIYMSNSGTKILCTGGFGEHFNTTDTPHAGYLKQWLVSKGVNEGDILPPLISSNTYEDIKGVDNAVRDKSSELLIVVTSDFHMKRVRLLYKMLVSHVNVVFVPAISTLDKDELTTRIEHEESAIGRFG